MSGPAPVVVRVFGCTDVGRTRDHNEDAFVVADLATATPLTFGGEQTNVPGERGALFMVADGMGGAAAGEIASSMAVDAVLQALRGQWLGTPSTDPATFAQALLAATTTANDRIHRYALEHPEYRGMGTTATVAGVLGDTLYIAQVGDSRAYLIRRGEARQLTKDQSLMQRLIEAGEITAEEAEVSERRNIILQALGPEAAVKVDVTHQQLRRGDMLVLCSDGLSGLVRDREIARAVTEEPDLGAVCKRLIGEANAKGGPDNITVVVARFEGAGLADAGRDDEVGHRAFPVGDDTPPSGVSAVVPDLPAPEDVENGARPPEPPKRSASTTTLEIAPKRSGGGLNESTGAPLRKTYRLVAAVLVLAALIAALLYSVHARR